MLVGKLSSFLAGGVLLVSDLWVGANAGHPGHPGKKTCVIEAQKNGGDDSPAIQRAFQECGRDGHIVFTDGTVYNIETMLQLHNLSNVQVDLRGTLRYSTDVRYWIQHGSYYYFQNISIALEFSGDGITIDGHGTGTIDGQGQVWYDLAQTVGGYYGRPIPFSFRNARNSVAKNFSIIQSQKWNFVIVESENILADNIYMSSTSNDYQANPGNLGNTDGFDTINSKNITLQNSYIDAGDDCVAVKPGSYDIHIKNLTCVNTAGIAIGSLGQYANEFDIVENVLAEDVKIIGARNGAYLKSWVSFPTYYPPQGGGNGTGHVRNVSFRNLYIENAIRNPPVALGECSHYAGYGVPENVCENFPFRDWVWENISWHNKTGWTNSSVGSTVVDNACSPNSKCTGFSFTDIDIKPGNNATAVRKCANVEVYDSNCQRI